MKRFILALIILLASVLSLISIVTSIYFPISSSGSNYYIDPINGSDKNSGSSYAPFKTIQKGVNTAQAGDTINLVFGVYNQDITTKRDGTIAEPIIISGSSNAIVKGNGHSHIIDIKNSYITLDGFTVDGLFGDANSSSGYRKKLIYVMGTGNCSGISGIRVLNMTLINSGGEALRFRYFVRDSEVAYCNISHTGVRNYIFGGDGTYGEGIYIGTATDQLADGKNPTTDPDECIDIWVHNNFIATFGAECVDIKEASHGNIIEGNVVSNSVESTSGSIDCRGEFNIIEYNDIYGNSGAGVRLGGDNVSDGTNNLVEFNYIHDNGGYGIKVVTFPQVSVCNNSFSNNSKGDYGGTYGRYFRSECGD